MLSAGLQVNIDNITWKAVTAKASGANRQVVLPASRLRVLKYLHIHIRFALIELTQAGRLRSRSFVDSISY